MRKEEQKIVRLYEVVDGHIPKAVVSRKNASRGWEYGYNEQYDMVVISKTGQIGELVSIAGLIIALPLIDMSECFSRSPISREQKWERTPIPKELSRIQSIHHWNELPNVFKNKWVGYIEQQFDYRENGYWFMNNGVPTYITGSHHMYLQWSNIDIGYPDFREANRVLYIFWESCKADFRCYGIAYLKIRRSGFSFMTAAECINIATLVKKKRIGILSKTGPDAKKLFVDKVVPINDSLPFFYKPIMDGMDKPKTELSYKMPASKITKKNMFDKKDEEIEGLDTTIDWKNTADNSYDSEKLILAVHDESAKWIPPNNIKENWRVVKTCLRLGNKIVGKCMMGSTSNALSKGGQNYKDIYYDSDVRKRNKNGQTKSGLYSLFIPMEWNMEGFIDEYGMPVFRTPEKPIVGADGELIKVGAIDYWEAEVEGLKSDADALNEHYRQFPRTEAHAFRDESKQSLFNLTKLYQQIDYNDSTIEAHYVTRGNFYWRDGIKDTCVLWSPNKDGRFAVSWFPEAGMTNRFFERNGVKYPLNDHLGVFGSDPYDISAVVGGGGSKGALHGKTGFHMDNAPVNKFFLEYIERPPSAEIFFEDVLMAIVFYGMPILAENNRPRLLYHIKNRGYRGFSMNRPDKAYSKLTATERELGGIPNSSEDVKQSHASAIETYIEKYIGFDSEGKYRDPEEIGDMPFNKTLLDWARFDIENRNKFDASISSGLAIMGTQRHLYKPEVKKSKISVNFARYSNDGMYSKIIK